MWVALKEEAWAGGSRSVSLLLPFIWNTIPAGRKKLCPASKQANRARQGEINLIHKRQFLLDSEEKKRPAHSRWGWIYASAYLWRGSAQTSEERGKKKTWWNDRSSVTLSLTTRWIEFFFSLFFFSSLSQTSALIFFLVSVALTAPRVGGGPGSREMNS